MFPSSPVPSPLHPLSFRGNLKCVTLIWFIHFFSWLRAVPVGSGDSGSVSFPPPAMPTSGCSLEPEAAVGSSELLCLLVSESVPDTVAGCLSSLLSELDVSAPGSLTVTTSGSGSFGTICSFFFTTTGAFFEEPGTNLLPPGTVLVALKRKAPEIIGFLGHEGLPGESLRLVLFTATILLTTGLVLVITGTPSGTPSLLPCCTCTSGDGFEPRSTSC